MGRYRLAVILIGLFIIFSLTGCSGGVQQKPLPSPTKIAVSVGDLKRDGNEIIKKVMKEREQKENLDITFMDAKNDPAQQEKHINKMIENKVKAAVIQFIDLSAAPQLVQKLKQENIKVIAMQNLPYNTPVDAFVASNNTRAGELQVRFIREALEMLSTSKKNSQQSQSSGGQQGQQDSKQQPPLKQVTQAVGPAVAFQLPKTRPLKVLIMQGDKKDRAATELTSANINAIKDNPDMKLLKAQAHSQWDPAQVTATLAEMMASDKQPDVILANDSKLAMTAVQFLKEAGLDKKVITVGMGANEKASMALVSGDHEGEVDPMPEMLAQYTLDAASNLAQEKHWQYDRQIYNGDYNIPSKIVPVRLIGKNNAYLLQERWKDIEKKLKEQKQSSGGQQQGESKQSSSSSSSSQGGQGQQAQKSQKGTTLKITTQEGKVMEVKIDGSIKKIESKQEGEEQGSSKEQQGQGGGGGGQ